MPTAQPWWAASVRGWLSPFSLLPSPRPQAVLESSNLSKPSNPSCDSVEGKERFVRKILVSVAIAGLLAVLAGSAAAGAAAPSACSTAAAAPPSPGIEEIFKAPAEVSTCTNCKACSSDADCGTGQCVPFEDSIYSCSCLSSLQQTVCSQSCNTCSFDNDCPAGDRCIAWGLTTSCLEPPYQKVCNC